MKPFLPSISLLCAILLFSVWNCARISRDTQRWSAPLTQVSDLAGQDRWSDAEERLAESYRDWSSHQTYLHIVAEHEAVDGAEAMYRRAFAYAEARETPEFRAELTDLLHQLNLLSEMEEISIKNIL